MANETITTDFSKEFAKMDHAIEYLRKALGVAERTNSPVIKRAPEVTAPCMRCGLPTEYDASDTEEALYCKTCQVELGILGGDYEVDPDEAMIAEAEEMEEAKAVFEEEIMDSIHKHLTTAMVELEMLRRPELRFR